LADANRPSVKKSENGGMSIAKAPVTTSTAEAYQMRKLYFTFFATIGFFALASISQAVSYGSYTLDNHPDGNQAPPAYGLRLDGLLDGSSVLTFRA
jgi:hypothetical protein